MMIVIMMYRLRTDLRKRSKNPGNSAMLQNNVKVGGRDLIWVMYFTVTTITTTNENSYYDVYFWSFNLRLLFYSNNNTHCRIHTYIHVSPFRVLLPTLAGAAVTSASRSHPFKIQVLIRLDHDLHTYIHTYIHIPIRLFDGC